MLKHYFLYITIFISGAVILIVEIAGAKLLAPFYGSTIFVWSSLITVTMGFLAVGYFVGGILVDKYPQAKWFYSVISLGSIIAIILLKLSYPILIFSTRFGFKMGSLIAALLLFAVPLSLLSMAGPFVIRLCSRDTEHTGHVAGIVFGISTLGSLAGSLLVGFYLIPNFFLSTIFMVSLSVLILFAVLGLILEKAPLWMTIGTVLFLIILFIVPFAKKDDKISVLYHEPSFYGEIRVIEHNNLRCLEVNSSAQTCVYSKTDKQFSPYGQMINALVRDTFIPRGNLLVLGLGGGALARDMQNKYKYHSVDTVEIDNKIAQVARDFFEYDDSSANVNTFITDARTYVKNTDKKYDVVILDAFSGGNPAAHLYTEEAFAEIKNILTPRGVLIVNSIGRPFGEGEILPQSIFKTIATVFDHQHILSTQNVKDDIDDIGNIIFMASLESKRIKMMEEYVVDYSKISDDAEVFSDNLNSIELLSVPFVHETQKKYQEFIGSTI